MNIAQLITQYELINARLVDEISGNADELVIRKLDAIANETCAIIAQVHLTQPLEINKQVKFFMNRSRVISEQNVSGSDFDIVENLIDRYTNRASIDPVDSCAAPILAGSPPNELLTYTSSLRQRIETSESRISLFNLDYRFEQTSVGNASFHATTTSEFNDKQLVNVVGETRFVFRAKAYLDRVFSGKRQRYSYFLDVPNEGEKLLSCDLNPVRDSDGNVRGALFEIADITDVVTKLSLEQTSTSASFSTH